MLFKFPNLTNNGLLPDYYFNLIFCGSLVAIVTSTIIIKNQIISVLFLIFLFAIIGAYLVIIGLEFVGFSYIIIYVGAVIFCRVDSNSTL